MKKSNLFFTLGTIIMLIGIIVVLQASDMNPLLAIDSYFKWINTHYYSMGHPSRNILMIFVTYAMGAVIIVAGYQTTRYKGTKKS